MDCLVAGLETFSSGAFDTADEDFFALCVARAESSSRTSSGVGIRTSGSFSAVFRSFLRFAFCEAGGLLERADFSPEAAGLSESFAAFLFL